MPTHRASTAQHVRDHRSALAAAERRVLIWIAERLPGWVNSDHLSTVGLGFMVLAGASFAAFRISSWAAAAVVACLAVNWFGDSLDGTLARVRRLERPRYGFYVDHVIDIAGVTALMTGIAFSGLMHLPLAAAVLSAYLLVSAETYLATHSTGIFRMSVLGFGPTELRLLIALGAIRGVIDPTATLPVFGRRLVFDIGGVLGLVGLLAVFVVSAIRNTKTLYLQEPLPRRAANDVS